ncbi:FKBP-type 22 kDa peptidyl-prolyl cis-trans isomerase [Bacteroidales bacterium Barb6]|nr:FKBP-type 22 kDa peptidyl-prolyl cis-trans isomerase [Bacteroidales bacterium Barb6]OAV73165.1 FKBP-type 22 kDa peptidyl-prolyl cis-trans isomerase [Bacteroidales bacterium Barb6]OAV76128.1 FKBP-type 22 kDa peptidyl-prolyl cis-trans isomerase [Bacteroidales bacterium Barb7]
MKMRKLNYVLVAAFVAVNIFSSSCQSRKSVNLKTGADSAAYAIGILNGEGFKQNMATIPGDPINPEILLAAFEAALKGDTGSYKIKTSEAQEFMQTYFTEAQSRESSKTKEEGDKFLEENKTKADVITTESGLQYQVLTEGTGVKPVAEDQVRVHYTGTLLDGTVFDSSVERGEPAVFGVSQVIKGWQEGLQIMPVGSKYIFWIPSDLAYGDRGAGGDIKPGSTLKFEVELLEIVKE